MIAYVTVERAEIPPEWIAERREVVQRVGYALRGGTTPDGRHTIEVKTQRTREALVTSGFRHALNEWGPLGWHHGALAFATAAERDAVLGELR